MIKIFPSGLGSTPSWNSLRNTCYASGTTGKGHQGLNLETFFSMCTLAATRSKLGFITRKELDLLTDMRTYIDNITPLSGETLIRLSIL